MHIQFINQRAFALRAARLLKAGGWTRGNKRLYEELTPDGRKIAKAELERLNANGRL